MLVDGEDKQLRYVEESALKHGLDVTIVLNIMPVSEHLWKAAHCFHEVGSDAAQEWVAEKMLAVLRGNAGQVAGGMNRDATMLKMSDKKRENIDKCAGYLSIKRQYMRYNEYLAAGFQIGSGVIKGACRYLVKDRMDITGARWGLANDEAILKFRALRTNGDLDDYLEFHRQEEHKPNYQLRCATRPHLRVIKQAESGMGNGLKKPVPAKKDTIRTAPKFLVSARRIAAGEKISPRKLWVKRPDTGIEPVAKAWVAGRTARRDIEKNSVIRIKDLE